MASARRRSGYVVENSIGIAAPAEAVFDYVTDVRREPEWNPQLREAEKLTPGPVGAGTRYRVRFGRGVGAAIIENWAIHLSGPHENRPLDAVVMAARRTKILRLVRSAEYP